MESHQEELQRGLHNVFYAQQMQTSSPLAAESKEPFGLDGLQDAARLFLAAQNQPSLPDTGSEYQSSSAQSASGDPTPEPDADQRPSAISRKSSDGPQRGHKHKWSAEETQALVDGCNKHGVGSWKKILSDPQFSIHFSDRSAGDLKDRFRTYFPDSYHELYPNAKTHLSKAVRGRDSEGKSIFEKGKTKERRPFSAEEDAAVRAGYLQHGSHWALIAKDPVFQGQRRAIDVRDRFRNAFPEDYERAGFKPRPSKAKKERPPSKAVRTESGTEALGPASDHALSDSGWRGDYSMSDATSDGHLTDHGNQTDTANYNERVGPVLSGPSSGPTTALGRSSSFNTSLAQQTLVPQKSHMMATSQRNPLPVRPQYVSSHTAPIAGAAQNPSAMVTGNSISHLFEQLQQASLDGQVSRDFSTPPSANESDNSQSLSPVSGKADEARRLAAKHGVKDATVHKRRSHVSKTGKNSALERLPSVHSHLHGHVHHPHAHAQPNAYVASKLPSAPPSQRGAPQSDVMAWLNPTQQDIRGNAEDTMDVDEQAFAQSANPWPTYSPSSAQTSNSDNRAMQSSPFDPSSDLAAVLRRGQESQFNQLGGREMPARSLSAQNIETLTDMSSTADASRRSSSGLNTLAQQLRLRQQQQLLFPSSADDKADPFSAQSDLFADPLQDLLDPLVPPSAVGPGWNTGWNTISVSDSGRDDDEVGALLSSLPLSHHHWAGDLHHHSASSTSWYNAQLQQNNPSYYGGANLSIQPSVNSTTSEPFVSNAIDSFAFSQTPRADPEAVLRAMSVDAYQTQQRPSTTRIGFDETVFSSVNKASSSSELELNREQTFTARDVGSIPMQGDEDGQGADSGDEQRRRSTDTLRRAEGSLEQALESVEDTRALQFAQQFPHDEDSDEDAGPGDDDGYEEDEEDDDDYEAENTSAPTRTFDQVFDDLQTGASESYAASLPDTTLSTDFFDGPFDASQPGASQTGFSVDDSNLALYQDLTRSPRFTADAQAFLASLNQEVPSWASAVSDSEMVRPYGRTAQSPTIARGSVNPSSAQLSARSASSASYTNRRTQQDASSLMPSGGASFLSGPPSQAVGLGGPSMTGNAGSANAGSGAGAVSMDSLWATSGSLDRLEHLYLEGLHSSPAMGHASAAGLGSGGVGTDFGLGGSYTVRPGWMSNPGELAGDSGPGPTGGYLSE